MLHIFLPFLLFMFWTLFLTNSQIFLGYLYLKHEASDMNSDINSMIFLSECIFPASGFNPSNCKCHGLDCLSLTKKFSLVLKVAFQESFIFPVVAWAKELFNIITTHMFSWTSQFHMHIVLLEYILCLLDSNYEVQIKFASRVLLSKKAWAHICLKVWY